MPNDQTFFDFFNHILMIKDIHIVPVLLIFLSGCATLNIQEIINLESKDFDTLQLCPAVEPNGLRIDLLRKNHDVYYIDSLVYAELMPYHPLGFDLGNGIFYDLSGNLSFKIDYLLNFSSDSSFQIEKSGKKTARTIFLFYHDSLSVNRPPKTKIRQQYHRVIHGDSVLYSVKKGRDFTVVTTETDLFYMGKKRIWNGIHGVGQGRYELYRKATKGGFSLNEHEVILSRDLMIRMNPDKKKLQIFRYRRKGPKLLLTIERSEDKIFVYDKHNAGQKIALIGNTLEISNGKKMLNRVELIEKATY